MLVVVSKRKRFERDGERNDRLLQRESRADADARPRTEGKILETADLFAVSGQEALRHELPWLVPIKVVAVQNPGHDEDCLARGHFVALPVLVRPDIILQRRTAKIGGWGIEAHRLLKGGSCVRQKFQPLDRIGSTCHDAIHFCLDLSTEIWSLSEKIERPGK